MSLPGFGVRKPVAANLIMFALIGLGLIFGLTLRREFFPEVRPTQVQVSAPYPGAAPDEVEDALAIKIEDRLVDLDGVVEMQTTVREGLASVLVEFAEGTPIDAAVADVKREVDSLQDLPDQADRIVVSKFEPNLPVIVLSLFGDADERALKGAIKRLREDLRSLEGMGDISISGVRTDEIRVEIPPAALLEHRVSLPFVADRVREGMLELPSGSVRSATQNTALRTLGADDTPEDVREIVIKAGGDGQVLRLGDLGEVRGGFVDIDVRERLNGQPSVSLTVFKVGREDAVDMASMVKAYVAGLKGETIAPTLGERIRALMRRPGDTSPASERLRAYELGLERAQTEVLPGEPVLTTDLARFIVGRLDLLTRNAAFGLGLVFVTLVLLLNWRISFWVAVGLGVSLLSTLAVMSFLGLSLNLLTMFGLIVVIGLLVDDAIVVAENITSRHERGEDALTAAVNGANQVAWPVVTTVLTTICAFMPLALIQGSFGDLLEALPFVVSIALGVSLIEALIILPSHMGHSLIKIDELKASGRKGWLQRFEYRYDAWREGLIQRALIPAYAKLLRFCLTRRWMTATVAVAMVIASSALFVSGRLSFVFFDSSDAETINGSLVMPIGTPVEETDRVIRRLEAASLAQPEVSSVYAQVGAQSSLDGGSPGSQQSHLGQIILELVPVEDRDRRSGEVIVSIQDALGEAAGVKSLRLQEVAGGPDGPAITYTIVGDDPAQLSAARTALMAALGEFESVFGIADDADAGQRELRIRLRPGASELGFTVANIARQVQGAVFGLEAFTFAGDREDVDVRVTLTEDVRRSLAAIERLHVFTPTGNPTPLAEVATLDEVEGYATVRRLDRKRAVTVTADVNRSINSPEEVTASLGDRLREIEAAHPGTQILKRGRQEQMADAFSTLPIGALLAAGLIYVVLAWLFSSYFQPIIVMTAIPFATIGMIWGHFLLGYDLTFLSLIGFVALAGIVVNDSLIFIQFFNEKRALGLTVYDAAVEAGQARFRAIMLTTLTTVLGLLPLMLEQSFQARFLIPMAITISFGLLSATGIILIVLPCLLMMLRDVQIALSWVWHGRPPIEPTPGELPDHTPIAALPRSPDAP
ncbi:MAG: efflux RND transporter permease subunit [Planctomycetota bacterium]